MALIKYGGGIIQMSGSVAGGTYARNRYGNYMRARTKPVNPNSTRQTSIRAIVSFIAEYWHEAAMATKREGWNTYAAAVAMKNKLGETIHLTGFNHFVRCNTTRMLLGATLTADAPTIMALPEKDETMVCTEEDIALQSFTFTFNADNWGIEPNEKTLIFVYQGLPQTVGRNSFGGPWRYMDYINTEEGATGTWTGPTAWPFGVGMKIWFAARISYADYRLSERWIIAPRTILADV